MKVLGIHTFELGSFRGNELVKTIEQILKTESNPRSVYDGEIEMGKAWGVGLAAAEFIQNGKEHLGFPGSKKVSIMLIALPNGELGLMLPKEFFPERSVLELAILQAKQRRESGDFGGAFRPKGNGGFGGAGLFLAIEFCSRLDWPHQMLIAKVADQTRAF